MFRPQAKLAELKKQNKELEKRMKLMATTMDMYGRLVDRLSNESNVLQDIKKIIDAQKLDQVSI